MWGPQRPKFWILAEDFGFWWFWILGILNFGDFGFWSLGILDFGSWGFWILGPKSKIQNPPSKIQNPNFFGRFWGFWILDFGPLCSKSLCGPKFRWFLILDLGGFWIWGFWDFGFWGFWILDRYVANLYVRPPTPQIWGISDFGILEFGDFGFCDKFWILHKKKKTVHAEPGRRISLEVFRIFCQHVFHCPCINSAVVFRGDDRCVLVGFGLESDLRRLAASRKQLSHWSIPLRVF